MTGPIRHLRGHLRQSDAVAALLDEVERREGLLRTIRAAIPAALAIHCRQASLDAGRLTLLVDSPAWVDRLRFLSPQFVDAVSATGVEILDCRVRVLPIAATPVHPDVLLPRRGSAQAQACLEQTAASLGDTPLGRSLARLARSCGHPGVVADDAGNPASPPPGAGHS